jgi:hypothetical protein
MKHRINKMIIHIRILSLAVLLVMASLFLSTATLAEGAVRSSYVSIPVSAGDKSWSLAAKLNYPLDSANAAAVVIVHGSGVDKIAKCTIFLGDMSEWGEMNIAYIEALGDHRPARSA